jgi:hypothetical protein
MPHTPCHYFHLVANGKHRKTRLFKLEDGNSTILGEANLKRYVTKYYKGLFGKSESNSISLDESIIHDIPQVNNKGNEILTALLEEQEVSDFPNET